LKVKYYTKKIDKILYGQVIWKFVAENIADCSHKLKGWTIKIYPVEMFDDIYPSGTEHLETLGCDGYENTSWCNRKRYG